MLSHEMVHGFTIMGLKRTDIKMDGILKDCKALRCFSLMSTELCEGVKANCFSYETSRDSSSAR